MRAGSGKKGAVRGRVAAPAQRQPDAAVLADFDTQLMLALRDGDSSAGNMLVRRNFQRVAAYLSRLIHDPAPVEDLTQDVFLQVFKAAGRYEPAARFSTWLYRIATNAARNYLTRAGTHRPVQPDPDGVSTPAATGSAVAPDQRMTLDEVRAQVAAALGSLPVNQRIALALLEFEGLSYEQIAAILDVSVEAVRGLVRRARQNLRPMLRGLL